MLVPVLLPPGLERNNTPYETPNRWWDANLVRWKSGSMLPVGGWNKLTAAPLDSAVRKIFVYRDNSNQRNVLIGTDDKLYTDQDTYVDITPSAFVPLSSIGIGGGYGTGLYGVGTYGTARAAPSPAFSPFAYWTFDNWGEDVIMTANSDGRLFYYATATATTAPAEVTTAPDGNNAVLVTNERHVMAIGQNGGTGGNYRRVAWSSREDYTDWDFASVTNTAGFQDLSARTPLLKGVKVREGVLIFSASEIFLAQYVGQPFIYGFTRISEVAMLHPDSIATFDGKAAWMSHNGFQLYNGGVVSPLDCPLFNDIEAELDPTYGAFRVHGCYNGALPEIWWFYPTTGNTEANRCVYWNILENWWAWGMLARSAMSPADVFRYPYMGNGDGNVYEHEVGFTDAGNPRFQDIFVETGVLPVAEDIIDINGIQAATGKGFNSLNITAFAKKTPEGDETTYGPYNPRSDGYTDTRINGRDIRLRYSPMADVDWAISKIKLDIPKQTGAKR